MGPPALQLVLDPQAVIFLDNRLYIQVRNMVTGVVEKSIYGEVLPSFKKVGSHWIRNKEIKSLNVNLMDRKQINLHQLTMT